MSHKGEVPIRMRQDYNLSLGPHSHAAFLKDREYRVSKEVAEYLIHRQVADGLLATEAPKRRGRRPKG